MKTFTKLFNQTLIIFAATMTSLAVYSLVTDYHHAKLAILVAGSDSTTVSQQNSISKLSTLPSNLNPNRVKDFHQTLSGEYFYILSDHDLLNNNCKNNNLTCKMTFMLGNKPLGTRSLNDTPINGGIYASIAPTDFHLANTNTYIISAYVGNISDPVIAHQQIVQIDKDGHINLSAPFEAKDNQLSNSKQDTNIYTSNKTTLTILGNNNSYYQFTNGKLSKVKSKTPSSAKHQLT